MRAKIQNSPASSHPCRRFFPTNLLLILIAVVSLSFVFESYVSKGGVAEANEAERPAASSLESVVVTGKILDPKGQPLAGAKVSCSLSGMDSDPPDRNAISDEKGEFRFEFKMPLLDQYGYPAGISIWATHADFFGRPCECGEVQDDWSNVTLKLCPGTIVRGAVMDSATQKPAAGVRIVAKDPANYDCHEESTDASGRFKIVLPKGKYWLYAFTRDRIAKATMVDTTPEKVELAPIELVRGGKISGRIIRESTGKPLFDYFGVPFEECGLWDQVGHIGPGDPIGSIYFSEFDADGRFSIHVYPGENYPYISFGPVDQENAEEQTPVVVKDGETVEHDLIWDFEDSEFNEQLLMVDAVIASLPKELGRRAKRLMLHIDAIRRIDHDVHWANYLYELIRIGPDAVPTISQYLDYIPHQCTGGSICTCYKNDPLIAVLVFTLRAIDDPRGVPALIRTIPYLPDPSDYFTFDPNEPTWPKLQERFAIGVMNPKPRRFLKQFELAVDEESKEFLCILDSRTEVAAALTLLTKRNAASFPVIIESFPLTKRRQRFRRNRFNEIACEWSDWWEANWQKFTKDEAYAKVDLPTYNKVSVSILPVSLKKGMSLLNITEISLSPATDDKEAMTFLDLDGGLGYRWPAHLPRDEETLRTTDASEQLTDWAKGLGIDLMAGSRKNPDDSTVLFLRLIDATVYELAQKDFETAASFLNAGVLPKGEKVTGEIVCPDNAAADAKFQKPHCLIMTKAGTWLVLSCSISRDESNASSELLLDIQEILEPKSDEQLEETEKSHRRAASVGSHQNPCDS